jgi:hypothetical protein
MGADKMTEELEKEAKDFESRKHYRYEDNDYCGDITDGIIQAYIAGAEPREKRIEELEKENKLLGERCNQLLADKGKLTDELDKWKSEWNEQVIKANEEGFERTKQTIQLSKAKEDVDKMKSRFLELCHLKDMRIEKLEKANEWHYMKDVNCYEDLPQNKDVYYAYVVNVGAYDKPIIERKLGCFAEFEFDVMAYHVIAWKEIVLPELKESK